MYNQRKRGGRKVEKDLTQGNTLKLIISFCIPLIGGALFQQIYNIVDTMIVGQFVGVDALAAVGATGSLNFLVLGFTLGLTNGFGIPISQAYGAKRQKLVLNTITNAVYLCIGTTLILTILMHFTTYSILELMQTPSNIIQLSYDYIIIIFYGMTCTLAYNMLASISKSLGDSKTPLIFLLISSVLNIFLDLFMIINLKMGVQGAAIATIFSQGVSAVLCFIYMWHKYPNLRFDKEARKIRMPIVKHLLEIALPMALQYSITAVGTVILQTAVNSLGSAKVAALSAGQKLQMFFTQPMDMLGATMATFCGQNYGAKKFDRIFKGVKESMVLVIGYAIIACIFMNLFGKNLALLFVDSSETAIIADTQTFLVINSTFFFILGTLFVSRNIIQGLGKSTLTMLAGAAELVARSVIALVFVNYYGFNAILAANPLAWLAGDIILIPTLIYMLRKMKKESLAEA